VAGFSGTRYPVAGQTTGAGTDLARTGLGLVYSLLGGLALSQAVPGYDPLPAAPVLAAFKAMVRNALPAPDGR
jgi:hypothetical protein